MKSTTPFYYPLKTIIDRRILCENLSLAHCGEPWLFHNHQHNKKQWVTLFSTAVAWSDLVTLEEGESLIFQWSSDKEEEEILVCYYFITFYRTPTSLWRKKERMKARQRSARGVKPWGGHGFQQPVYMLYWWNRLCILQKYLWVPKFKIFYIYTLCILLLNTVMQRKHYLKLACSTIFFFFFYKQNKKSDDHYMN